MTEAVVISVGQETPVCVGTAFNFLNPEVLALALEVVPGVGPSLAELLNSWT